VPEELDVGGADCPSVREPFGRRLVKLEEVCQ
jgi:hypothetical protein